MEFGFEWMENPPYIRMSIYSDEPVRHRQLSPGATHLKMMSMLLLERVVDQIKYFDNTLCRWQVRRDDRKRESLESRQ